MYFYQDSNSLFHVGNDILPAGRYMLKTHNNETVINIANLDGEDLDYGPIEVTSVQKEDGSTYADLAELLTAISGFFG